MKIYDSPVRLLRIPSRSFSMRPVVDATAIADTIQNALASAGLSIDAGPMKGVTDTIQQALSVAGARHHTAGERGGVTGGEIVGPHDRRDGIPITLPTRSKPQYPGEFVTRSFTNHAGTRAYKLYVPASYRGESGEAAPLVVMLHGCTQSPDDFAAGTRMNVLAEEHGFLVVYPAQAPNANGSKCWNWFRSGDQSRDCGEPSLIAGITLEVAASYRVDKHRIFVAGLSAGAAMAVILGATYPDLYCAVGAHSGLPYRAAHDVPSAFGAMAGGEALPATPTMTPTKIDGGTISGQGLPTIVFHGDCDQTVSARNGAAIVAQAIAGRSGVATRASEHHGGEPGGCRYSHTIYSDIANRPVVEHWVLHGGRHAWSGGSSGGSFTDVRGPDASAEMIRFFYSQQGASIA